MTPLERRIIDLSYRYRLSHIGSCLTAVGIIDKIYEEKKPDERFVLSCGHAGLALYVVLEKYVGVDAEQLLAKHGVHPNRDDVIDCSTGSLGQGLPIALGMALADRSKNVYCLISDGECSEGSVYEALCNAGKYSVNNLITYCNWNGYGAYGDVSWNPIENHIDYVIDTQDHWFIKLYGQEAHYRVLTENDYQMLTSAKHA